MPYFEKIVFADSSLPLQIWATSQAKTSIEVHPHFHEEIEILYYIAGTAKQQVGECIFEAKSGDIIIINSNELHSTYSYGVNKAQIIIMQIDANDLALKDTSICETAVGLDKICLPMILNENDQYGKKIVQCINEVNTELSAKMPAYQYLIKSRILELAGLLIRNYGHHHRNLSSNYELNKAKTMLKNTFELIDKNYTSEITLEEAASCSNLSTSHFCRLFKQLTGYSFKTYISMYRVNRAEQLLSSHFTLTDIALQCGFGSLVTFDRQFRKYKKCSPSSLRMANLNG